MGFLNLNSERKFLPRLDMDLRAGRFFAVERTQNAAGEWESEKVENAPTALCVTAPTVCRLNPRPNTRRRSA
jgi:hypothetical protein